VGDVGNTSFLDMTPRGCAGVPGGHRRKQRRFLSSFANAAVRGHGSSIHLGEPDPPPVSPTWGRGVREQQGHSTQSPTCSLWPVLAGQHPRRIARAQRTLGHLGCSRQQPAGQERGRQTPADCSGTRPDTPDADPTRTRAAVHHYEEFIMARSPFGRASSKHNNDNFWSPQHNQRPRVC